MSTIKLICSHCGGSDLKSFQDSLEIECLRCNHKADWRTFEYTEITDRSNVIKNPSNIEELNLSVATYNSLKRHDINTTEDLLDFTKEDLYKIRNLNTKRVDELLNEVYRLGYKIKE